MDQTRVRELVSESIEVLNEALSRVESEEASGMRGRGGLLAAELRGVIRDLGADEAELATEEEGEDAGDWPAWTDAVSYGLAGRQRR